VAYAITQNCCNDASCVVVCPVGCIHPAPGEPGFATAEMLYIDPKTCIDCGACADACPVDAIRPTSALDQDSQWYQSVNAAYYQANPLTPEWARESRQPVVAIGAEGLRVAIVGSGAAGWYAAKALLRHPGVRVHMFDRVPAPHGLIRYGVAPDHPHTKAVVDQFHWGRRQEQRFELHLGVEVGAHISHDELMNHHHAVIYANGAGGERRLDIPGEESSAVVGAMAFVGWYNAHPEHSALDPELGHRRAVVIGNGNVALDMARILTVAPDDLASTDIADHAVDALRRSNIEEVVVLGRRGPEHAAFTTPELHGLSCVPGLDVVVDARDLAGVSSSDPIVTQKLDLLHQLSQCVPSPGNRRIILRFNTTPVAINGERGSAEVLVRCGGGDESIATGLVLRSVGFQGVPIAGVPFDGQTSTIPNDHGRVVDPQSGQLLPGVYATGWISRGPTGGIGTNRSCAEDAVAALLDDHLAGALDTPAPGGPGQLIARRRPEVIGKQGWAAIDRAERAAGAVRGKPRSKLATTEGLLSAAVSRSFLSRVSMRE